jgi:hypothetical protein
MARTGSLIDAQFRVAAYRCGGALPAFFGIIIMSQDTGDTMSAGTDTDVERFAPNSRICARNFARITDILKERARRAGRAEAADRIRQTAERG